MAGRRCKKTIVVFGQICIPDTILIGKLDCFISPQTLPSAAINAGPRNQIVRKYQCPAEASSEVGSRRMGARYGKAIGPSPTSCHDTVITSGNNGIFEGKVVHLRARAGV